MYYNDSIYDDSDYDDSDDEGDYYEPIIDEKLIGRWRSFEGDLMEFDVYGNVENSNFRFWKMNDTASYATWTAYDGRIYFTTAFCHDEAILLEEDRFCFTRVNQGFYRDEKIPGEGIVGKWIDEYSPLIRYQFYEDGTGLWLDSYYLSWGIYHDGDTERINFTIFEETSYDYLASGNTFTLFYDNGSTTFTKISD